MSREALKVHWRVCVITLYGMRLVERRMQLCTYVLRSLQIKRLPIFACSTLNLMRTVVFKRVERNSSLSTNFYLSENKLAHFLHRLLFHSVS